MKDKHIALGLFFWILTHSTPQHLGPDGLQQALMQDNTHMSSKTLRNAAILRKILLPIGRGKD